MEPEIQLFMLKTQKIREKAAKQLQNWIEKAEKFAEQELAKSGGARDGKRKTSTTTFFQT